LEITLHKQLRVLAMTTVNSNGLQLAYEEYGNAADPAMLMVQGLGMPLSGWPPALLDGLVAEGFRVIIFDNRDIGRSELLQEMKVPNMLVQTLRRKFGFRVKAPYQLNDMMLDTVGLMDALQIESAHVVGISMGGMISQLLAIHEPQRVRTLTSIMSTTGSRKLPGPTKEVTRHIVRGPRSRTDEGRLEFQWKLWRMLGGPGYRLSDEELAEFLRRNFERGLTAAGIARQTLAILAAPSRAAELRKIDVPSLIIHGDADPLVPVECGLDTARAIPGARTAIIEGMGHDLPIALTERLVRLITQHAITADNNG
jgi:pimeloyl-ACP methyl ester carboxylesterase